MTVYDSRGKCIRRELHCENPAFTGRNSIKALHKDGDKSGQVKA